MGAVKTGLNMLPAGDLENVWREWIAQVLLHHRWKWWWWMIWKVDLQSPGAQIRCGTSGTCLPRPPADSSLTISCRASSLLQTLFYSLHDNGMIKVFLGLLWDKGLSVSSLIRRSLEKEHVEHFCLTELSSLASDHQPFYIVFSKWVFSPFETSGLTFIRKGSLGALHKVTLVNGYWPTWTSV